MFIVACLDSPPLFLVGVFDVLYLVIQIKILHIYLQLSCTLHFDGASKGNPGPAGAGAILRDGNKVSTFCHIILLVYFLQNVANYWEFGSLLRSISCVKEWAVKQIMLLNIEV